MIDGIADDVSKAVPEVLDYRGVDLRAISFDDEARGFLHLFTQVSNRTDVLPEDRAKWDQPGLHYDFLKLQKQPIDQFELLRYLISSIERACSKSRLDSFASDP